MYANVDLVRRTIEMKNVIKDLDIENANLIEIKEFLSTLSDRKCDSMIIVSLDKKLEDVFNDLQT